MPNEASQEPQADASLSHLSAGAFRPHLNTTFVITHPHAEGSLEVELIEVGEIKSHSKRADRTPFSLLFRGPENAPLEQGIYRLTHETMGETDLFLVTLGPGADDPHMRYEVVFT